LTESITFQAFNYTRRGTLEADKMIIASMLCFRIMIRKGLIDQAEVDHLVRGDIDRDAPSLPENLKFIPEVMWPAVKGLEKVKCFDGLQSKMESESPQFKKWYADQEPEVCDMPKSIKDISLFHRIILLRALRPDRLINALKQFVRENMGEIYVEQPSFDIIHTYSEMNTRTPIFFVLFPGVDPTPEVEKAGYAQNKTIKDQTFINISMGQGQEDFSIKTLKEAGKNGNWVMFQNVHLMQSWMKRFEREFEIVLEEEVHPDFRCFISSEPPPLPEMEIIPESILQNSLKVANEAPTDLKSNIRRAYSKFEEDHFEKAKTHKEKEYKALLFGLIMFHSLILGRRKFGSQGWSRKYNFNDGDLRICGDILHNYLSKYDKVPYADLRYLYGEIMYGGHITDDWDRRTNSAYLLKLIVPNIMMGMNMTLAPGFRSPDPAKFGRDQYIDFVETKLPIEVPQMFGLHPNAEIGYLTTLGEKLFITILSCSGDSGGGGGVKKEDVVKVMLLDYLG
jgi:dynein heavy chain